MSSRTRVSHAKQFAEIENLSMPGIVTRMGPVALHVYAEDFLNAATALPAAKVPFQPSRWFLPCRAIELALKAFLSLKGAPMLELAGGAYGHDLHALLQQAQKSGLADIVALESRDTQAIERATEYYIGKARCG